jgi:hypothetical protein
MGIDFPSFSRVENSFSPTSVGNLRLNFFETEIVLQNATFPTPKISYGQTQKIWLTNPGCCHFFRFRAHIAQV